MLRLPPRSTRTDTRCAYTTLFRSGLRAQAAPDAASSSHQLRDACAVDCSRCGRIDPVAPRPDADAVARRGHGGTWNVGQVEFQRPRLASEPYRNGRSEEHTSELQSLMRISYAVFCLKKKKTTLIDTNN